MPRSALPLTVCVLLAGTVAVPGDAAAQIFLDWPIRESPGPEALLTGVSAVPWNPGGLAAGAGGREEVWILHLDGPEVTGLTGLAVGAALDLPLPVRMAAYYRHLGVPDVPATSTSPEPDLNELSLTEDGLTLALATDLGTAAGVGAALRYARANAGGEYRTGVGLDVGAAVQPDLPLRPRLGLAVLGAGGEEARVLGGAEVAAPDAWTGPLLLAMGYGIAGGVAGRDAEQRVSLSGTWRERFHAGLGFAGHGEPDGWTALWMLGAEFGRYSFAVLREHVPNGLGPAHLYRASVRLP